VWRPLGRPRSRASAPHRRSTIRGTAPHKEHPYDPDAIEVIAYDDHGGVIARKTGNNNQLHERDAAMLLTERTPVEIHPGGKRAHNRVSQST
jgi:hypothetical protein